jgi:hypothetical protein
MHFMVLAILFLAFENAGELGVALSTIHQFPLLFA